MGSVLALAGCGGDDSGEDNESLGGNPPVTSQSPAPDSVGEFIPESDRRVISTEEVRPFIANTPYAAVLAPCIFADSEEQYCQLSKLPYIGQQNLNPSVSDIMERLLVTHDWMGVRFRQMLERLPADILPMFAPVTAVVIGSEVRPSSFNSARGRIRLDPRMLWLSVDEKRTISTVADYRSEFGSELQFVSLTRFASGDSWAWRSWSLSSDSERTLDDIEKPLASLLYHELAHANDYIQPDRIATLSSDNTPLDAVRLLEESRISRQLYEQESLTAQRSYLYGLAGVRYFDDEPTEFQKSLLADFVGAEMGNEGKATFYSYSTIREDVADIFETAMMKFHYGIDVHVAFANKPVEEEPRCDDYQVAWGIRNRLASRLVISRARYVASRILPSSGVNAFLAGNVGSDEALRQTGWCDSVSREAERGIKNRMPMESFLEMSRPYQHVIE